jgi:spore germination protein GerM
MNHSSFRRPLTLFAIALAAVLAAACAGSASPRTLDSISPSAAPSPSSTTATVPASVAPSPAATPATQTPTPASMSVKAYFLLEKGGESRPVLVPVQRAIEPTQAVARAALTELLGGPTEDERTGSPVSGAIGSAIHPDTRLLDVTVTAGTATVDLSADFLPLDIDSEEAEHFHFLSLAQVTYTLTQFPTVDRVAFRFDGERFDVREGHEGTTLEHATRDAYLDQIGWILLDDPAWGADVDDPVRLSGLAGGDFEAAIVDTATGDVLVQQTIPAPCGSTGCTLLEGGAFADELPLPPAAGRSLGVRVWPSSEGPDSPLVIEYPLR